MKTIIAGSRDITDFTTLMKAVDVSKLDITSVVSGGARGVDKLGEIYASRFNLPIFIFKANWDKHGKKAGILRNIEMARNAEALLAIWDGKSRGTLHMITEGHKQGLRVHVYRIK